MSPLQMASAILAGITKGYLMTLFEIGLLLLGWFASIMIFYTMGVNSGYVEGRRALRKHYEQRDKVRS